MAWHLHGICMENGHGHGHGDMLGQIGTRTANRASKYSLTLKEVPVHRLSGNSLCKAHN